MVERDLAARGVRHAGVLRAMGTVPRERFLPDDLAEFAYDDHPLPIVEGQTISQPYIVAVMAEAAEVGPDDRVLEVGAGSGYGAAVLSRMAADVWTIERHEALAAGARSVLDGLGYDNVARRVGRRHARVPGGRALRRHRRDRGRAGGAGGAAGATRRRRPAGHPGRARDPGPGARAGPPDRRRVRGGGPRSRAVRPAGRRPGVRGPVGRRRTGRSGARDHRGDPAGIGPHRCGPAGARAARGQRPGGGGGRAVRLDRRGRRRAAAGAHRRLPGRAAGRGVPRDVGVLPDAGPHHPGAHPPQGLHGGGRRGRLARRRPRRRATSGTARRRPRRSTAFTPVPHLDVAQPGGGRVRRTGCGTTTPACEDPGRQVAFCGLDLYRLYTLPRRGARATSTGWTRRPRRWPGPRYWLPLAVGARPGQLRPGRRHRPLRRLRGRRGRHADRPAPGTPRLRQPRRRRLPRRGPERAAWWPTPSGTTG